MGNFVEKFPIYFNSFGGISFYPRLTKKNKITKKLPPTSAVTVYDNYNHYNNSTNQYKTITTTKTIKL